MGNQRIIFYVDGFNFYYGLKTKNWRRFYWLDMIKFAQYFVKPHQELKALHYFSAVPTNIGKAKRQEDFFSANKLNPLFNLHLGYYSKKDKTCSACGAIHHSFEEKETDVRIATQMIRDVVQDKCDVSVIISADSDLVPPIEFIREYKPTHKIITYFPPSRYSANLRAISNTSIKLDGHSNTFNNCLLDNNINHPLGFILSRPINWV